MNANLTERSTRHHRRSLARLPRALATSLVSLYVVAGVAVLAALTVFVAFAVGLGG